MAKPLPRIKGIYEKKSSKIVDSSNGCFQNGLVVVHHPNPCRSRSCTGGAGARVANEFHKVAVRGGRTEGLHSPHFCLPKRAMIHAARKSLSSWICAVVFTPSRQDARMPQGERFAGSHCHVARLSWTEKELWGNSTPNASNCDRVGIRAATARKHCVIMTWERFFL